MLLLSHSYPKYHSIRKILWNHLSQTNPLFLRILKSRSYQTIQTNLCYLTFLMIQTNRMYRMNLSYRSHQKFRKIQSFR